jgi:SOS-response transcriptional repressor LexA
MNEQMAGADLGDVLRWIVGYRDSHGYPPSRRELTEHFGVSLNTAQRMLARMIEEGLLEVTPNIPRGINITGAGMKAISEDF